MGLDHDFLLLDRTVSPPEEYNRHHHSPDALRLHDNLLHYMGDALSWIPTENPAKKGENGMGLYLWGVTVISQRGASKLHDVCNALAALFALGPETLNLRGLYSFGEKSPESGAYDRLEVSRDELVGKLRTLAEWAGSVADKPQMYILHMGI